MYYICSENIGRVSVALIGQAEKILVTSSHRLYHIIIVFSVNVIIVY